MSHKVFGSGVKKLNFKKNVWLGDEACFNPPTTDNKLLLANQPVPFGDCPVPENKDPAQLLVIQNLNSL